MTVKEATSASTAELRPVEEAREDLRSGAQLAMETIDDARAMRLATPVRTTLHALPPADISAAEDLPGIAYEDQRATFVADDFQSAYDGVIALVHVATAGYSDVLGETVATHPDGTQLLNQFGDNLMMRWLEYESGRWTPEASRSQASDRVHHGAN
ncbi:MAG TPA: M55 family metallopeptidase [Longimicrobiaceae bacterium]|nr:M55 family metallopeptidase [Longimicrobiaceae bacterium]